MKLSNIAEGISIVVFSAIIVWAMSIVWDRVMNQEKYIDLKVSAAIEILSGDIETLSTQIIRLNEKLEANEAKNGQPVSEPVLATRQPASELLFPDWEDEDLLEEIVITGEPIREFQPQQQQIQKADILERINTYQQQQQQTRN